MNATELKEYLAMVLDLEKELYILRNVGKSLLSENRESPPVKPDIPIPAKVYPSAEVPKVISTSKVIIGSVVCGVIIGTVLMAMTAMLNWWGLFSTLGTIVCLAILFWARNQTIAEAERKNREKAEQYERINAANMEEYRRKCEAANVDYPQQLARYQVKHDYLTQQLTDHEEQIKNAEEALARLYSYDIIFPKYRNMVMVSSLYEYISSGRCSQLEGHEGGYNVLETEIRMDRIITQMDTVISQLNAIQQNQFILYSAIQEVNQQSRQLLESTNRIVSQIEQISGQLEKLDAHSEAYMQQLAQLREASALNAYYSALTQRELQYMNRMDYITGRNATAFDNAPPT